MMKNKGKTFHKRITAFLSALLMLTAITGCSKNNNTGEGGNSANTGNSSGSGKSAQALNISFDHSYASEKINFSSNIVYFNSLNEIDGNLMISGYTENDGQKLCLYNIENGSTKEVELEYPKTLDENVDYYLSASFVNAQNQPIFIYHASSYDETSEEASYQDLGYTMEIYDSDFHLLETKDLKDIFKEDSYFTQLIQDNEGNFYAAVQENVAENFSTKIYIYDKDFNQKGEVNGNIQYVQQMFINGEGKIILNYQDNDWKTCFGYLNTETNTLDEIKVDGMPQWFNTSFCGKKDYDLFVGDSTAVYGLNLETGKCEEVINWINSDFIGENVNQVIQLEDGRFILTESDYTSNTTTSNVWILNERDPKEFENVQLISLATLYMPSELNKAVNNFNRTHTDYRIGVMNYEQYNTDADYEAGLKQFENDMTSGIMADIICMSYMPYERYANKGLLMDFSNYISQLNPDEYFTNFFDSLRYGEKLYRIGFSYNVSTLEAKTDNVNGKNGLSLQEFSDLIANLPAGTEAFSEMTKDSALSELATTFLTNFIDVNTGACTFNSPEFVKLLELCNSYPSSEDDSRQDWEQEEWEKYWAEESYQYINDKTLFREATISDIKSYLQEKTQYFGDADVTLVGGPTNTEGSNGGKFMPDYTISASANSVFTNQIWEFCQQLLSEDAQESLSWSLPVSKKAFDKAASNALKPDTYIDEDGKEVEIPYTIWRGDEEVEVPLPTQADVDAIKTYIENIKETMYYNEQIYNIVYEEAQKYFSGDQTAQAAADMIQSRASIYLSEQT
ncbi:MAG: carbohydrate ABC transporter substrate-binding protein [Oscillospiraceae bacterium]|nr:carbohydrate ABC transporter substrate-binding protein [Oscillospiraceae bacterium]